MKNFDYDSMMIDEGDPVGALSSDILDIIDKTSANEGIGKRDEYIAHFNKSIDRRGKSKLAQLVAEGQDIYLLKAAIPSGGMVGIQVFMLLEKLSDGGEVFGTLPDGDSISNGRFDDGIILLMTHTDPQVFENVFQEVFDISPVYEKVSPEVLELEEVISTGRATLSENEKVDSLINQVEELMLYENSVTIGGEDVEDGSKQIDEIKVKVDDLNKLFQLIEELVLIRNQFTRINETRDYSSIRDINRTLDRTTNDLYNGFLSLKLVSVGQIFNHMRQFVSNLSEETGKQCDFIIKGETVHVDRSILEELIEPVKALLSNAIFHGLEEPEDRRKKGKLTVGTIIISAENYDDSIRITLEDDGVGLCPDLIKETALSLGLTSKKIIEGLDEDVFDLLSLPGFTTIEYGDESETKEMGINAIKQRIESNGGTFEIRGELGKGTLVTIVLPTNLAIKRVLLFQVGDTVYATPATAVQMVTSSDNLEVKSKLDEVPLITYRDRVIPLYDLASKIGLESVDNKKTGIILEKRNKQFCVTVSRILGFEEVAVKSTQEHLLNFEGIIGLTILSDGRATPILDLWSLVQN